MGKLIEFLTRKVTREELDDPIPKEFEDFGFLFADVMDVIFDAIEGKFDEIEGTSEVLELFITYIDEHYEPKKENAK